MYHIHMPSLHSAIGLFRRLKAVLVLLVTLSRDFFTYSECVSEVNLRENPT